MITKELTQTELQQELLLGGLLAKLADERPHLAVHVMNGHTAFTTGDTTVVRKGSSAANHLRNPVPALVTREREDRHESSIERLFREAHHELAAAERSMPTEAPRSMPTEAPRITPPAAERAPAKAGHAKIADRLDGKASSTPPAPQTRDSRIATQRAVQAARAPVFELPTKLAERLGKLGGAA